MAVFWKCYHNFWRNASVKFMIECSGSWAKLPFLCLNFHDFKWICHIHAQNCWILGRFATFMLKLAGFLAILPHLFQFVGCFGDTATFMQFFNLEWNCHNKAWTWCILGKVYTFMPYFAGFSAKWLHLCSNLMCFWRYCINCGQIGCF